MNAKKRLDMPGEALSQIEVIDLLSISDHNKLVPTKHTEVGFDSELTASEEKLSALIALAEKLCDAVENMNELSPVILGPNAMKAANEVKRTIARVKREAV